MDGLFAGAPPLEALRFLIHEAATVRPNEKIGMKVLMINDVARGFFEAPAIRQVCIEVPKEYYDDVDGRKDIVGHINMSLHGARDAAINWQEEVAKEMSRWGVRRGNLNPCLYGQSETKLMVMVHGDGFMSVGTRAAAKSFREKRDGRFEQTSDR